MSRETPSKFILEQTPYYSQFASANLVGPIVNKEIPTSEDPLWHESGATTIEEYEFWAWNLCGMACLKSVLDSEGILSKTLIELAKQCVTYGGYRLLDDDVDGLFYREFVDFVLTEYGIRGDVIKSLTVERIVAEISKENFVIASVHPSIRDPRSTPPRKGGHLVLLLGYDLSESEELLILHDPSGYYGISQEFTTISVKDFEKFFAGRGVVLYKNVQK